MMTMQNNSYRSGLMVVERRGFDLCVCFSCYDYISITINCINYEQRCVFNFYKGLCVGDAIFICI